MSKNINNSLNLVKTKPTLYVIRRLLLTLHFTLPIYIYLF